MTDNLPEAGSTSAASASHDRPQVIVVAQPGRQTVWWVLTVVLAVIATALVTRRDERSWNSAAMAQAVPVAQAGARGIYAFTGQLTSKSYGLFMMDVDSGTVWCYEMRRGPNEDVQMKLVAARSWLYDRYLEEFNVAEPIPSAVQAIVQQRLAAQQQGQVNGSASAPATAPSQ